MARIDDDIEIGGKEYNPVRFRLSGDEEASRQLAGFGRRILGDLKRQMQLGELTQLSTRPLRLDNGSIIQAHSRFGEDGMPDMDEIWISTPSGGGEKIKCIGYIVQVFLDSNQDSIAFLKVTTPSGKVLGLDAYEDIGAPEGFDVAFDSYPDNGAKYEDHNPTDTYPEPEMQTVFVSDVFQGATYQGYGPITVEESFSGDSSLPPLGTGWVWVTSYSYSTGSCGGSGPWEEEATPFSGTITLPAGTHYTVPEYSLTGIAAYYVGTHSPIPPFNTCENDGANSPSSGTGLSAGDWNTQLTRYGRVTLRNPLAIQLYNSANAQNYEYHMANTYVDWGDPTYSAFFGKCDNIIRRKDGHGFITRSGFDFDSGEISLKFKSVDYGHGALFMVPDGDKRRYRYAEDVVDANTYRIEEAHDYTDIGNIFDIAGTILDGTGDDIFGSIPETNLIDNSRVNVTDIELSTHTLISDPFGIPCKVEEGIHKVEIQDRTNETNTVRSVKVHLFFDNGQSMTTKQIDMDATVMRFDTGTYKAHDWEKDIKIKVGEFLTVGELISFVDPETS